MAEPLDTYDCFADVLDDDGLCEIFTRVLPSRCASCFCCLSLDYLFLLLISARREFMSTRSQLTESQREGRDPFIFPSTFTQIPLDDSMDLVPYLQRNKNNLLAEYWAFFKESTGNFRGWREKKLTTLVLHFAQSSNNRRPVEDDGFEVVGLWEQREGGTFARVDPEQFSQYHQHLIIFQGSLRVMKLAGESKLVLGPRGLDMSVAYPDYAFVSGREDSGERVHSFGYIGSYMQQYDAITKCLAKAVVAETSSRKTDEVLQILSAIARPSTRASCLAYEVDELLHLSLGCVCLNTTDAEFISALLAVSGTWSCRGSWFRISDSSESPASCCGTKPLFQH